MLKNSILKPIRSYFNKDADFKKASMQNIEKKMNSRNRNKNKARSHVIMESNPNKAQRVIPIK